jgi:replicative DNA helicase
MTTVDVEPPPDPYYDTIEAPGPISSMESEAALIGAVLMSEAALDKAIGIVTADDFYRPVHAQLWQTFLTMRAAHKPIDLVTVLEELRDDIHFMRAPGGGGVLLHDLSRSCPTATNAEYYAAVVAEKASLRRLVEAGHRIWQLAHDGDGAELAQLHARARDLVDAAALRDTIGTPELADVIDDYVDSLTAPPPGVVQTPWPDLDDVLNGGLLKGELVIVAARPGVGKSIVGHSCARAAAQLNIPTLVFSLEMPEEEVLARIVADTATVPLHNLIRHDLDLDQQARVARCADRIRHWPLAIHAQSRITITEIAAICRQRARDGLGLVVIDQLNLIKSVGLNKNANRQEEVASLSRELTILAKELGVPLLVLHQLNRGPDQRANSRPMMADLRETGQIEADAHKVLLLWRQEDHPAEITVIVAKNRNGEAPVDVPLSFTGRYARIRSGELLDPRGY